MPAHKQDKKSEQHTHICFGIGVGAPVQKFLHDDDAAPVAGPHQGCPATLKHSHKDTD